jgi:hypothetical protein
MDMANARARSKKSSSVSVPDEAFSRALSRIRSMTKAVRIQSLKNAGILTPHGNYTKPYRVFREKRVA